MRKRPSNDNKRPFGGFLSILLVCVVMWIFIIQGIAAFLKAIFG